MNHRRKNPVARTRTKRVVLAVAALGLLGLPHLVLAEDVSAPVFLQWFEAKYATIERRTPDAFMAGYGAIYTPPPGRAEQGNLSSGYDVYDRFDLGKAGNPTLYGTETGLKTTITTAHRAGMNYFIDAVINHNGFATLGSSDNNGVRFAPNPANPATPNAGGYPGLVLSGSPQVDNDDGDFHSAFNPNTEPYDVWYRLSNLVDIDHRTNIQYVRNPVPGFANNIPAGTAYAYGRIANVPDENNRRFYPDTSQSPIFVFDPKTGQSNIAIYPFNNASPLSGDPVSENALGYLMRYEQWMVQAIGVDGFRVDAARHVQPWVHEYLDRAVYRQSLRYNLDGTQKQVFNFLESYTGDKANLQSYIRKDINPANPGTVGGNRDVLDFPLFFAMQSNLGNNGFTNNWNNVKNASQDSQDDGLANNGSQSVAFAVSHDDGGAYLSNVAHAFILMRPGNAMVYFNAREFSANPNDPADRPFPKQGRGDALGGYYGDAITKLVDIRNTHGRGNYTDRTPSGDTKELLIFERDKSAVVLLSNRLDNGYDSRTVQTNFNAGTPLIELTGNAANSTVDPYNDIPELVVVNPDKTINIRVPRNKNANGVEHGNGYLVYGVSGPQGTLSLTNVAKTFTSETPTVNTNATARLTAISVITANSFQVSLATNAVNLLGVYRDADADGDNALLKLDDGANITGAGFGGDYAKAGTVIYGFQEFTNGGGNVRSPGFGSGSGNGSYIQNVDASQLSEGYHYLTVRAFRHRSDNGPAVFTDFKKAVYVDRLRPVAAIDSFNPIVTGVNENRDVVVKSTDQTATGVNVFLDLGASQKTDAQIVADAASGQNPAGSYDRDLFKYGLFGLTNGNHVLTVVTFEPTYDPALGYAGGGVNVQRFVGQNTSTLNGAGLGDLNFNGTYGSDDISLFSTVLNSNNVSFNPAADQNADGLVNETDLFQLNDRLAAVGASNATVQAYNNLLVSPPAATTRVFTGTFRNTVGSTITKTGTGTFSFAGTQNWGGVSIFNVTAGTVNFNTNAAGGVGQNLNLSVSSGATVNFNVSQRISSVTLLGGAVGKVGGPGIVLDVRALSIGGTASSPTGKLDVGAGALVIDYTGALGTLRSDTAARIRAARNGYDANVVSNWSGNGITSSSARADSVAAGFDLYSLGAVNNADLADPNIGRDIYTSFVGQSVDGTSLLVRYTYSGDADLNGFVDGDDYALIDNAYNGLIPNFGWLSGDFNYDGLIDGDDYALIDSGYLFQGSPIPAASISAVPEPAGMLAIAAVGLMGLLGRRRAKPISETSASTCS